MNFLRSAVVAATFICLTTILGLAQTPDTPEKRSHDEILNLRVAECSTFEEGDEPDECVRLGNTTTQAVLYDALAWLKIPSGIVLPPGEASSIRFTFHPSDLRVRNMLDSIVATDTRYQWVIEDGVVNLLLKDDATPLLDVRLAEFDQQEVPIKFMFEALEDMPEVRRRAAELGFSEPEGGFGFHIGLVDLRKFTVKCQNCTVREALNAIVRESRSSWAYKEYNYEGRKIYRFQ
jgi:hypothetical protein